MGREGVGGKPPGLAVWLRAGHASLQASVSPTTPSSGGLTGFYEAPGALWVTMTSFLLSVRQSALVERLLCARLRFQATGIPGGHDGVNRL